MNVYAKQKHTHSYRKQTNSYQRGEGSGEGAKLGIWAQEIQTSMYKIDEQQSHIV